MTVVEIALAVVAVSSTLGMLVFMFLWQWAERDLQKSLALGHQLCDCVEGCLEELEVPNVA